MTATLVAPWLLGVVGEGLVAVGRRQTVEVQVSADRSTLLTVLEALSGNGTSGPAGLPLEQFAELCSTLSGVGAIGVGGESPFEVDAVPLAAALAAARRGGAARSCYTADELLLLPGDLEHRLGRRALHAFVGGLVPTLRGRCYAGLLIHGDGVVGDQPSAPAPAFIHELDPGLVHVVPLGGGDVSSIAPADLNLLGADRAHRLGPIQAVGSGPPIDLGDGHVYVAQATYTAANLRFPAVSLAHGAAGERATAELIARAEGAERHAISRTSGVRLRRARASQLEGAVNAARISAPNARQAEGLPYVDPDGDRLWVAGRTLRGAERWIPAEAALVSFSDPDRPEPWLIASSSGAAAHTSRAEAIERAIRELVERDVLMWRWIRREAPARLSESALGAGLRTGFAALRRRGWDVAVFDMTLDTLPVVLCAARREGRLALGLSCARDPLDAAARAFKECLTIGRLDRDQVLEPIADPRTVVGPSDHLALHHHPDHALSHAFLLAGTEEVDPRDIPAPQEPLDDILAPIGEAVVIVFDVPQVRPFEVVRAVVPGLVPISFGYDREPLGLPRLAGVVTTRDGRTLGVGGACPAGPMMPHPFP